MLIFDQLKRNDPKLRLVTVGIFLGLLVLAAGLWWVQIVSARDYQANLETQSFRTVRIPAVRGKILDRNGTVLAENRATYSVSLYLDELRDDFAKEYARRRPARMVSAGPFWKRWFGGDKLKKQYVPLKAAQASALTWECRCIVASNAVLEIGKRLGLAQPIPFDATNFQRHYQSRLALPYPVLTHLEPDQIGRFEEQNILGTGADLEVQSTRVYPHGTTAAHLLGAVHRDDSSAEGEASFYSYRLPDYRGLVGIEAGYDQALRGNAGAKSVLVNNVGFRQTENIWEAAQAGTNVMLTIDLFIQQAAERALVKHSPKPLGAAVVMDVNTGDILALASIPTFNPNHYVQGFPPGEHERLNQPYLLPQINRATYGNYAPGSIFKPIVGLAALEAGLDPNAKVRVEPDPAKPGYGCIFIAGHQKVKDLAHPGDYDFRRALLKSSNAYFISNGIWAGIENIVRLGQRLHLGEKTGLPTRQEVAGNFPSLERVSSRWALRSTANVCIGQDPILVTPLQMTVMTAALANGGKVLWPRLVDRLIPQDPTLGGEATIFPSGQIRDQLGVKPQSLRIVRDAMLAETEDSEGTGQKAVVPGLRICGKTGTAQVENVKGDVTSHQTWFISYAPYENPKYAVVAMVDGGSSGGGDCAPIAHDIYTALLEREKMTTPKPPNVAQTP